MPTLVDLTRVPGNVLVTLNADRILHMTSYTDSETTIYLDKGVWIVVKETREEIKQLIYTAMYYQKD